jgi:hypothetical protein
MFFCKYFKIGTWHTTKPDTKVEDRQNLQKKALDWRNMGINSTGIRSRSNKENEWE